MNVALAGLTDREAVALGMLVGKALPGWRCSAVPAGRGVALPPADLYVLDLSGLGLARWSQAAQDDLLDALKGAPAVLVAPAFDQTWSALDAGRMKSQSLVLLHKPYGIEDMRAALNRAAPAALPVQPPASAAARTPVSTLAPVTPAVALRVAAVSASLPAPAAAAAEAGAMTEMTIREFQARLAGLPASASPLFLRQLAQALSLAHPFEVRVSFLERLIVDPAQGWAASNTPVSVLQALCRNDAVAAATVVDAIPDNDARARAQRLDMPVEPLHAFLGMLMKGGLDGKP